jgi:hypothetical protein
MSEFSFEKIKVWMQIAWLKRCSVQNAIHFDLFFESLMDHNLQERAEKFFEDYMVEKMEYKRPISEPVFNNADEIPF